jgi:nitroreductase
MSFLDLVKQRFSCRSYQSKLVEVEKITQVLEAARWAPSACNFQPWYFIVVREPQARKALNAAYEADWFAAAPVALALCLDTKRCWKRGDGKSYGDVDIAITMDHLTLAATELGLGTCWLGAFKADVARKALALPDHVEPLVLTPLGYPAVTAPEKKRKELGEMVYWERFGGKR